MLIGAGVVLAPACTHDSNTLNCGVEGSFSDEQRTVLFHAAEQWNVVAAKVINLSHPFEGADCRIMLRDREDFPTKDKGVIGLTREFSSGGREVYIMRGMDLESFHAVALHEFGHLIGIEHHLPDDQVGVMSAESSGLTAITFNDILLCKRDGACK